MVMLSLCHKIIPMQACLRMWQWRQRAERTMACLRMWLWDDSDRMWQRHNAGLGHKRGFLDMRYPGYIKWIIQIMTGRIFSKELKMMMMLSLYYSLTPMQAWQCICKVYWLINADTQLAWALIRKRTRHGVSEDATVTEREAWRVWGCKTDRTVTGRERDTRYIVYTVRDLSSDVCLLKTDQMFRKDRWITICFGDNSWCNVGHRIPRIVKQ
jgi:hypothetical protein